MAMNKWSFKEDFKRTDWKSTLVYNLQRAFAAGIVFIILGFITREGFKPVSLLAPIFVPIFYLLIFLPVGILAGWLSGLGVPFVGLITFACSFFVMPGDPLVWIAHEVLPPGFIPIEKPKFISASLVIFLIKEKPKEGPQEEETETEEVVSPLVYGPEEFARTPSPERPAADYRRYEDPQNPSYVDSVITKSLIDQAILLKAKDDQDSAEKAHLLWEQALKMGGLSIQDELLCHYYLGSYYQGKENLAEAIKHNEKIAISDQDLVFLNVNDETTRIQLKDDLFKTLSAAYQYYARTVIKEHEGLNSAIAYIEKKLAIIADKAAPSLLVELGSYYGLAGNSIKAKAIFEKVLEVPSYGSQFQEDVKKSALDFLKHEGSEQHKSSSQIVVTKQPPVSSSKWSEKRPPIMKWVVAGILAVASTIGLLFVLMPSPYKEYIKKAQASFNNGNYNEALTLAKLAREEKSTGELEVLEAAIQAKLHEQKSNEEAQKRQAEYSDYFKKAEEAFARGDNIEARNFVRLAAEKIPTRESGLLESRIEAKIKEEQASEKQANLAAAEESAFRIATNLNTEAAYRDYLQAYPTGRYADVATKCIEDIQLQSNKNRQQEVSIAYTPTSGFPAIPEQKPTQPQTQDRLSSGYQPLNTNQSLIKLANLLTRADKELSLAQTADFRNNFRGRQEHMQTGLNLLQESLSLASGQARADIELYIRKVRGMQRVQSTYFELSNLRYDLRKSIKALRNAQ
jgi:hypothetical protein